MLNNRVKIWAKAVNSWTNTSFNYMWYRYVAGAPRASAHLGSIEEGHLLLLCAGKACWVHLWPLKASLKQAIKFCPTIWWAASLCFFFQMFWCCIYYKFKVQSHAQSSIYYFPRSLWPKSILKFLPEKNNKSFLCIHDKCNKLSNFSIWHNLFSFA